MKDRLKALYFGLLGKQSEAVVVSFWSGDDALASRMIEEIRKLVPDRRHFVVTVENRELPGVTVVRLEPGSAGEMWLQLRRVFRNLRVGLAPVLFTPERRPLRIAAFLLAPRKILAYNQRLERHHLRLRTWIASALFLRGVAVDRIFLRPKWLVPWKEDRTEQPSGYRILEGRATSPERRRVAVLSPYLSYPLSHGGAVRVFHLLREAAQKFDLFLFAFGENTGEEDPGPLLELCAQIIVVPKARYREPRWASLAPPEVAEFDSPAMRRILADVRAVFRIGLLQVEYTQLARYGGDVLVEHDVTFDLFAQTMRRSPSLSARWDLYRWRRFERQALRRYRRVVVMSEKDADLLGRAANIRVIENGVDLDRFRPQPETPGERLLFIGSFRHFPNVTAWRFFHEEIWPQLRARFPGMTVTVVAGPDHLVYWRQFTRQLAPSVDERIRLMGFVEDVRPLYVETNLVIVPTTVSAGTNVKVLEAMAMERAVVSTASGCAGLGLKHDETVWIADGAREFMDGVAQLIERPELRLRMARSARKIAEEHFDWRLLGQRQRELWDELMN